MGGAGPRPARAGTWASSDANNAVTETPARLAQARKFADQSIVLLKNAASERSHPAPAAEGPALGLVPGRRRRLLRQPVRRLLPGRLLQHPGRGRPGQGGQRLPGPQVRGPGDQPGRHRRLPAGRHRRPARRLTRSTASSRPPRTTTPSSSSPAPTAAPRPRTRTAPRLALPGAQSAMISQVEAANPNTIVYLETSVRSTCRLPDTSRPCCGAPTTASARARPSPTSCWARSTRAATCRSPGTPTTSQLPAITDYTLRPTATTVGRTYQYFTGDVELPVRLRPELQHLRLLGLSVNQPRSTRRHHPGHGEVKNNGTGRARGAAALRHHAVRAGLGAAAGQAAGGLPEGHPQPGESTTVTSTSGPTLAFFDEPADKYVVDPGRTGCSSAPRAPTPTSSCTSTVTVTGTLAATPTVVTAKPGPDRRRRPPGSPSG